MMSNATELCRKLGIQRTELDAWIEAGWLRPARERKDWRFSTIDLVRAQFILDLRGPMGVNDDGVAVILDLLDQIHGLRRALRAVATGVQKAPPRARQPGETGLSLAKPPSGRAPRLARRGQAAA
jgi:chaperone modulatory protein CbpM